MKRLISCEYNFDNCCVELKFTDGSMIAIDTIAVENEVADNMYQRSELDWLIYNKPLEYAQLVFSGNLTKYIKESPGTSIGKLKGYGTALTTGFNSLSGLWFLRQHFFDMIDIIQAS